MKILLIPLLCVFLCLPVTALIAEPLTSGISSVNASLDNPPFAASVYIADAQAAVSERNWTRALLLTTRGLAFYPDEPELYCLQGYTLRKLGQYRKAVDAVSEGIRRDPRPVRYANRGYAYLALGNYSAALADAESGIALNASYPTVYGVKALALQGMGRNTDAGATIGTALALDPESAHYWHVKGRILAASGNCTGARKAFETSLALDPGYDLPWPAFTGAGENLGALDKTCGPATQPTHPATLPGSIPAAAILAAAALVLSGRR
ncbi:MULTISPECIES: tetratricopeptide repeat protein [unclassified Methanoregula]|uniref:tetratricopeptide repeat protein n=1 Tax=unclassified Methanoregula TaxID=2649730 RepID=UPI0009CA7267|nr:MULTISPECIES: tetratricopeptide repeat protein [unclassified Methanoregula]OPX64227.1 MAG: Tetratricopeptide repeat protein [Methanoregula sp. PtaB.Bin085]OPY33649.1 MAG: Tetratricopeptide repeat protein [Methanoregula sp. PtaU1.Bin006]